MTPGPVRMSYPVGGKVVCITVQISVFVDANEKRTDSSGMRYTGADEIGTVPETRGASGLLLLLSEWEAAKAARCKPGSLGRMRSTVERAVKVCGWETPADVT